MAKIAQQRVGISVDVVFPTLFDVQEFASAGCTDRRRAGRFPTLRSGLQGLGDG